MANGIFHYAVPWEGGVKIRRKENLTFRRNQGREGGGRVVVEDT